MQVRLDEYAAVLREEPKDRSPLSRRRRTNLTIVDVVARESDLLVTMRWRRYPFQIVQVLRPDDVLLYGGDLSLDDVEPEGWVGEALDHLDMVCWSGPMRSKRRGLDRAVEIVEIEPAEDRFVSGGLLGTAGPAEWLEVANYSDPIVPPDLVTDWRQDGSLATWHWAFLSHRYPLPNLGHAATRWVSNGVARLSYVEVVPDMPRTLPLVLAADAMHNAAQAGAATIVTDIDVPQLDLLGFRDIDGTMQTDTRFLEVDHDALAALVASEASWTYPDSLKAAIRRASEATYYAG